MKDKLLYHLLNFNPIKLPNKVQNDSWANLSKVEIATETIRPKIINNLLERYPLW